MDWLVEVELSKNEILGGYDRHDMPKYLEAEDIFQDVCEYLLGVGFDEDSNMNVVQVFKVKGMQIIRDYIRKERGQEQGGPRSFIGIEDAIQLVEGPEDFVGIGKDIRLALSLVENPRNRAILWMRYAEGATIGEIGSKFELSNTAVSYVLDKEGLVVKNFLMENGYEGGVL